MHRATWKRHERQIALALGGTRVPITGRARGSAPDVAHECFSIEVKAGKVLSSRLVLGLEQAQAAATSSGTVPLVVAVHSRGPGRPALRVALLALDDFLALVGQPQGALCEP